MTEVPQAFRHSPAAVRRIPDSFPLRAQRRCGARGDDAQAPGSDCLGRGELVFHFEIAPEGHAESGSSLFALRPPFLRLRAPVRRTGECGATPSPLAAGARAAVSGRGGNDHPNEPLSRSLNERSQSRRYPFNCLLFRANRGVQHRR